MSNNFWSALCRSYSSELVGPAFKNAASLNIGASASPDGSPKLTGQDFEI